MLNRNPASSGAGLSRELTEIAGLQPDTGYDEAILGEIATKLGLRSAVDIERELERAGTGATEVLVAVLGALQPWAAMMRDLLGLMTRHGINRSRTQLRAEVDVDAASDELNLDLRDFVEAIAEYEMAMTPVRAVAWTIRAYEELASVVPSPGEVDDARLRPEVRRWLDLYEPSETGELPSTPWPTPLPTPPACGLLRTRFDRRPGHRPPRGGRSSGTRAGDAARRPSARLHLPALGPPLRRRRPGRLGASGRDHRGGAAPLVRLPRRRRCVVVRARGGRPDEDCHGARPPRPDPRLGLIPAPRSRPPRAQPASAAAEPLLAAGRATGAAPRARGPANSTSRRPRRSR